MKPAPKKISGVTGRVIKSRNGASEVTGGGGGFPLRQTKPLGSRVSGVAPHYQDGCCLFREG